VLNAAGLVDTAEDILEVLPAGIVRLSADGRIRFVNAKARAFFALEADALGARYPEMWWSCEREDGTALLADEFPATRCLANGQPEGPVTIGVRRRDGEQRWGTFHAFPAQDPPRGAAGAVIAFVDITERIASERQLRDAESRNRVLVDGAFEGIAISVEGQLLECNRALAEMFGYTLAEWRGLEMAQFATPASKAVMEEKIRTGSIEPYVVDGRRKDGSRIVCEVLGRNAIYQGRRARVTGVRDVTERERVAEELRRQEDERRRLEEQIRQVQKLDSLGVLAGGVAHDFNNLLVGMMGYAELALREVPGGSPARECLQMVLTSARRAAELVQQMLAYAGRTQIALARVSLNDVIAETVGLVRLSVDPLIELELDLGRELPAVNADSTQLGRVVMSLITNASEAIGNAPGEIVVSTRMATVDHAMIASSAFAGDSLRPGTYVCFEVRDTGAGMDDETKRKLFEPFFTTKFTGRGLGLAAAFGIVRAHGGLIVVESAPGKGSRFQVYLRTADRPDAKSESRSEPKADTNVRPH
jgi:two-component system cell cycle sensor histidine kinase/response regulator CckA